MKNRYLVVILVVLSIISLFIGVTQLSLKDLLLGQDLKTQILLLSRIPRLVTVVIAGMSMAISGLILQQISRNRFVAPTTAATVDSAKLGVLVSLILWPAASSLGKMLVAFAFALAGTFLFMGILEANQTEKYRLYSPIRNHAGKHHRCCYYLYCIPL